MPRYYFHIRDHEHVAKDEEGTELDGLEAAKIEARTSAQDLAIDRLRAAKPIDGRKVEVTDESGKIVYVFPVRDLVEQN